MIVCLRVAGEYSPATRLPLQTCNVPPHLATILLEMVSGDDQFTRIQEEETAAEANLCWQTSTLRRKHVHDNRSWCTPNLAGAYHGVYSASMYQRLRAPRCGQRRPASHGDRRGWPQPCPRRRAPWPCRR